LTNVLEVPACLHYQGNEEVAHGKVVGGIGAGQTRLKLGQTNGSGGKDRDEDKQRKGANRRVGVTTAWQGGGKKTEHGTRQENKTFGMRTRRNK
jgi:hypothetical protein